MSFCTFPFSLLENIIKTKVTWSGHDIAETLVNHSHYHGFTLWEIFHLFFYWVFIMIRWPSYILGLIRAAVGGHIVDKHRLRQYYDIIDHYCWSFKGRVVHVVIACIVVNCC